MKEILVTAYPKSGQTWLIHMLCDLLNSPQQDQPLGPLQYWGPNHGREYAIRKRHSVYNIPDYPFSITPEQAKNTIIIFLQRDPRDVAVSQWYFRGRKGSFEDNARVMFSPVPITYEQWVGSWVDAHNKWLLSPNGRHIVTTRYEDLHSKSIDELCKVYHYITGLYCNPHYLTDVWQRHSFDTMREYLKRPDGYDRITRKGQVGDWRNHFTKEFAQEFDKHLGKFMLDQGYIESRDWWKEIE